MSQSGKHKDVGQGSIRIDKFKNQVHTDFVELRLYSMFMIPIFQPGINKSNHFGMNLSNLRWFVKKIFETVLVIMVNTI